MCAALSTTRAMSRPRTPGHRERLQREERRCQGGADERGKNGKALRSFAFARAFGRRADSAQPCCLGHLSERARTPAPNRQAGGPLVPAQHRPSISPALRRFLLLEEAPMARLWQGRTELRRYNPRNLVRNGPSDQAYGGARSLNTRSWIGIAEASGPSR